MYKRPGRAFTMIALLIGLCIWLISAVSIPLGIDLQGGTELSYELDLSRIEHDRESVAAEVKDTIARRLNAYGLKELNVAVQGQNQLVIQLPGTDTQSVQELKDQIEKAGNLTFRLVLDSSEFTPERKRQLQKDWDAYVQSDRAWVERKLLDPNYQERRPKPPSEIVRPLVKKHIEGKRQVYRPDVDAAGNPILLVLRNGTVYDEKTGDWQPEGTVSGRWLSAVGSTIDPDSSRPAVSFSLQGQGAAEFAELTGSNINKRLAIVLDDDVMQAPNIKARISTNGQITGDFTNDEVRGLISILRGGSLPTKPTLISESTVGSVLGKDSIESGLRATFIGVAGVMLFMAVYYLLAGMVANFALCLNLLLILSFIVCFRQTLTLPGIAGIILTLAMAVDANILIFERFREERRKGKSLNQSLEAAYDRAFSVIFDSNLTTIITGYVLFYLGTGPVKGFAVTLIAGLFASFFTSVFVTRVVFSLLVSLGLVKELKILDWIRTPRIPFVQHQKKFIAGSIVVIVLSWVVVLWRGRENYGIDFTGGARVTMNLGKAVSVESLREKIRDLSLKEPDLFRDFSVQTLHAEEAGLSRSFAILTRAGSKAGFATADAQSEAPNTAAPPPDGTAPSPASTPSPALPAGEAPTPPSPAAAGATSGAPPANPAKAVVDEPAQLVRQALEEMLKKEEGLLLPPPFPSLAWKPAADTTLPSGSVSLSLEVNLIGVSPELTTDRLREGLNEYLGKDPLFSAVGKEISTYKGVSVSSVELRSRPAEVGGVTRFLVNLTPLVPASSQGLTAEAAVPTRLQVEDGVRGYFRKGAPADLFRISEPFPQVSTVGPRVASDLQADALIAIFISILGIVFYLSLRFEFNFGLAGILALVHDVMVAIGLMAVVDQFTPTSFTVKLNLNELAAILTIIGFSINDTIVLFDRIRENSVLLAKKRLSLKDLVDISINQTLSRTLWTSLTVFLVTVILLAFGGESIRGFAFLFAVGCVAGTYSSIFIAAPIVLWLHERSESRRAALAAEAA